MKHVLTQCEREVWPIVVLIGFLNLLARHEGRDYGWGSYRDQWEIYINHKLVLRADFKTVIEWLMQQETGE